METLVPLVIVLGFAALIGIDTLWPARAFRDVPGWRLRGVVSFVVYMVVSSTFPLLWDDWLGRFRLVDARGLGTGWGALVALVTLEMGLYAWHRLLHAVPFLWRWSHQVHHSAERIDTAGTFYFSPADMVGFTLASSLSLVLVVGVTPEAAVIAVTVSTFIAMLGHANLRTPRWLGYLVHRPENHALHHERGVHAFNYGGLALPDMLFGTWRNPATWEGEAGFFHGSTERLGDMLLGRDIAAEASVPGGALPVAPEDGDSRGDEAGGQLATQRFDLR